MTSKECFNPPNNSDQPFLFWLKEQNEFCYHLFRHMGMAVLILKENSLIVAINPKAEEVLGGKSEEIENRIHFTDFIEKKDQEILKLYHQLNPDQIGHMPSEYHFKIKNLNGILRNVHVRMIKIHSSDIHMYILQDVTERQQLEEEHARLATAVDQSSEAFMITDRHGIIKYVNPTFEVIIGYKRDELLGLSVKELFSDQKDSEIFQKMSFSISQGEVWRGRINNKRKDGSVCKTETTISPVRSKSGKLVNFLFIKRDITTEDQLEEQLRQAQKLQAIGTLAGGIAHDFNNILSGIIGYTEMCLFRVPSEDSMHLKLKQVLKGCDRAKDLVKQILMFSRQNEKERRPVDVKSITSEVLKLLDSTIPTTIRIKKEITNKACVVNADPTQIHQIIMNLCTNAYQAMEDNAGTLTIVLQRLSLHKPLSDQMKSILPGEYVCLSISDTGEGISKEVINRIFEPYFTTKKIGKGTGLGLSVVHGIVKSHKGEIVVESTVGKGSTFSVYLPMIQTESEPQKNFLPSPLKGCEKILLVDDDIFVLEMINEGLKSLGYEVTTCNSSVKALEIFTHAPDYFDIVITDYTMPDMTGAELVEHMMAVRNTTPIFLHTGYGPSMHREKMKQLPVKDILIKPISISEMASRLRKVIDMISDSPGNSK